MHGYAYLFTLCNVFHTVVTRCNVVCIQGEKVFTVRGTLRAILYDIYCHCINTVWPMHIKCI